MNLSCYYDLYSAFWKHFDERVGGLLLSNLGIALDTAREWTHDFRAGKNLVDRLYELDPDKYQNLKRLKDVTVSLPADKGGGFEESILGIILLALLSSAVYDVAKAGGKAVLARMRGSLTRWNTRRMVSRLLNSGELAERIKQLSDEEFKRFMASTAIGKLSYNEKREIVEREVQRRADVLRRDLLRSIRNRKRGHITNRWTSPP